jgi:hypothetical protein
MPGSSGKYWLSFPGFWIQTENIKEQPLYETG